MVCKALVACLPWLAWLALSCLLLVLLVVSVRTKPDWARVRQLHGSQEGSAQSLSFVLVLPFFVMIVLFIVQVSELMIGTIMVHYAAYATARAAAVWIPVNLAGLEGPNCISSYYVDTEADNQVPPTLNPSSEDYGPSNGGVWYIIEPGSSKYDKITSAAVMACLPISPSRTTGTSLTVQGSTAAEIIKAAYATLAPDSNSNPAIPKRIENKLAYAMANTSVEIRFYHKNSEPPLVQHYLKDDIGEFYFNELGWQDQITVTVRHNLALLPGPGRFLAKHIVSPTSADDRVSDAISLQGDVYTYPLSASATISNEGEKSLIPHVYTVY